MSIRASRLAVAGALAVAAVAAPIAVALTSVDAGSTVASPACLSWYGNKEDGVCLGYSNGNGVNLGTPTYVGGTGPNSGFSTGSLLPGQTFTQPAG